MTTYSRLMEQRKEGYEAGLQHGISQGRSEGIQLGISRGIAQGRTEGSRQAKIETAKALLNENITVDIITRTTGLPRETVDELAEE